MTNNTNTTIVLDITTDATASALVATIKAAVNGTGKYAAYVAAHTVTRETVKDHALALAVLAYPNDAPVQKKDGKRTRFGNAVQAAGFGLRSALEKNEPAATDYLARVVKAVESATEHEISADQIMAAVKALLGSE